jgi:DNA-damage-inducible protein D
MGYARWEDFEKITRRALASASNVGQAGGFSEITEEGTGGRPRTNFTLTRFAAYLVAMNGDPNKRPVAAAQAYFAIRTREAEVHQSAPRALPQTYSEALRALADEAEAHELARVRIRELEPAASAWASLVQATGDYAVGDAAKMLSRDPSICIGQNTLFRWLGKHGWLYRRGDEWHPYQDKVEQGLLTVKANRPYWDSKRGVDVLPAPTIRVTAKGVQRLYVALGGAGIDQVAS